MKSASVCIYPKTSGSPVCFSQPTANVLKIIVLFSGLIELSWFDPIFSKQAMVNIKFTKFILVAIFASLCSMTLTTIGIAQSKPIPFDPGHKEDGSLNEVKFSVPTGFTQQPQSEKNIALMKDDQGRILLFVATPEKEPNAAYFKTLINQLAHMAHPNEKDEFLWKFKELAQKVSKYEVTNAHYDGFNGTVGGDVHYWQLNLQSKSIVVGYIYDLGSTETAKLTFEKSLGGNLMPAWYAEAHVIASITGEKYDDINPESYIEGLTPAPVIKKNRQRTKRRN